VLLSEPDARPAILETRGQHCVSIPNVLIAACAQQHGADVLHVDRHYDVLAEVLGRSRPIAI